MKAILLGIGAVLSVGMSLAQQSPARWCGTAERMNAMMQDPQMAETLYQDELIRQQEAQNAGPQPKGIVYKIPVVFHILHNNGPENISVAQIYNALDVMNRDFRLQNPDTVDVIPMFQPIMGDAEIEFALATKDPAGNCFRGYTRTQSALTHDGSDGGAQVDAIRNGNDVYQGNWPSNKYLNVFVIADAGGAGGYTNYPSNWGGNDMSNGIWILHTQFGEIGTSSPGGGRSMTHECGHWLNLMHTWGNSNDPGLPSNCNEDDQVTDTPLCLGVTGGCPTASNGCGPVANVQNYMDYALSCQSMFTEGQALRMRTAIVSSVGGRNNLWTAQNLLETGADGLFYLCDAAFSADKRAVCAGESVSFTDESFNVVNGWTWNFPGGSPSSSNLQNPVVTYSTPGLYEVSLTATDGGTSDTETKTAYIRVLPASGAIPFLETFENLSTLNNITEWEVNNESGNGFVLETSTGHTGTKCAKLANFGQPSGSFDELVAIPLDLTSATQVTMSFRYAYKRRNSTDDDWFRVYVTNNCGDTWALRKTLHGVMLNTQTQSSAFLPSSQADWITVHMTNITNEYWVDNFRYKFAFEGGGGNNIYLDNINIYAGTPSDDLVIGLDEAANIEDFAVYPNPADEEVYVRFGLSGAEKTKVEIVDVYGKLLRSIEVYAQSGNNLVSVETKDFAPGVYFVNLSNPSGKQTTQFVIR